MDTSSELTNFTERELLGGLALPTPGAMDFASSFIDSGNSAHSVMHYQVYPINTSECPQTPSPDKGWLEIVNNCNRPFPTLAHTNTVPLKPFPKVVLLRPHDQTENLRLRAESEPPGVVTIVGQSEITRLDPEEPWPTFTLKKLIVSGGKQNAWFKIKFTLIDITAENQVVVLAQAVSPPVLFVARPQQLPAPEITSLFPNYTYATLTSQPIKAYGLFSKQVPFTVGYLHSASTADGKRMHLSLPHTQNELNAISFQAPSKPGPGFIIPQCTYDKKSTGFANIYLGAGPQLIYRQPPPDVQSQDEKMTEDNSEQCLPFTLTQYMADVFTNNLPAIKEKHAIALSMKINLADAYDSFDATTPLIWACYGGHYAMVEYLLYNVKETIFRTNDYGENPFHALARGGAYNRAKGLEYCESPDTDKIVDLLWKTCQANAAEEQENNYVEMFMDIDKQGLTPLHYAAMHRKPHLVQSLCQLIRNSEDPRSMINVQDHNGYTPLLTAILSQWEEGALLLIDEITKECTHKNMDLSETLLITDNFGNTPLHWATSVFGEQSSLVQKMMSKPNETNAVADDEVCAMTQ